MKSKWWESLAALDGFMKVLQSQNIHSHGIVSVFDGYSLECVHRDSTIAGWTPFYTDPLTSSWGSTPLYDAINLMGRHLRDLDPPSASIVIVTDGKEASSTHTTCEQARAVLDWCRAKGWQVTFLGCDFNNNQQAKLLGASAENSIGVQKALLSKAGELLGKKRILHIQTGKAINFTKDEKSDFGGYLSDQR
jgi:hypothetical protein